jgi:hypothetical protein
MLIDLPTAKLHLRVDGTAEDAILPLYIGAAEQSAMEFLNRKVYADQAALTAAVAAVPASLTAATATYAAAMTEADLLADLAEREFAYFVAAEAYLASRALAREICAGMVVNDAVKAAVLLMTGHLFENRENVVVGAPATELPMGAKAIMQPYRVGLGA